MPIILTNGESLDVEKYTKRFNDNITKRGYYKNDQSDGVEASRRYEEGVGSEPTKPVLGPILPGKSSHGSDGSSGSGGVIVGDFEQDRVGEGNILVPIDNWRHAVIYAIAVIKKEIGSFKSNFYEKDNIYSTALFFAGYKAEYANYLTKYSNDFDYYIDNINLLKGLGLTLAERIDYSKSTFENLVRRKATQIMAEDEDLFDKIDFIAEKELEISEFLREFVPNERKFYKTRMYKSYINEAINELRKLGYIKHPKARILSGNSKAYVGMTERRIVKRSHLVTKNGAYVVHEDSYRLYHILSSSSVVLTGRDVSKIKVSDCGGIDIKKVIPYDLFVFFDFSSRTVKEVYEVVEIYNDEVRLVSSEKYISENVERYMPRAKHIMSETTLSKKESQSITFS